jgi:hypothetical protein
MLGEAKQYSRLHRMKFLALNHLPIGIKFAYLRVLWKQTNGY